MKTAFALGAVVAFCPMVLMAQTGMKKTTPPPSPAATTTSTTETSMGDVATPGRSAVTPAMLAAQKDPNLIGSPAWWSTHATADGQPLGAKKQ